MKKGLVYSLVLVVFIIISCAPKQDPDFQLDTSSLVDREKGEDVNIVGVEDVMDDIDDVVDEEEPVIEVEVLDEIIEQADEEFPNQTVSDEEIEKLKEELKPEENITEAIVEEVKVVNKTKQGLIQSDDRCIDTDVTPTHFDGLNYEEKGHVLVNGFRIINGEDFCANTVMISEWYCSGGIPRVKTVRCPSNCVKGVCA